MFKVIPYAWDIEILPNFFSIIFVDINDYLKTFEDCCEIKIKKGKEIRNPIPLTKKLKVDEIKRRLDNVKKYEFYITDKDDSQLLPLLGFVSNLKPFTNPENKCPTRFDLFGYNSNSYDKLMLAALLMYYNTTNSTSELISKLYNTSKHIINMQNNRELAIHDYVIKTLKDFKLPFISVDIMTIFALNKAGTGVNEKGETIYFPKSLKQTSINLQWYELLEHTFPPISELDKHYYTKQEEYKLFTIEQLNMYIDRWDRYIIPEWIKPMMHYNLNDVFIVCEIIRLFHDEISLRYNISKVYEVNVLSSSRSNIADTLFVKFYSDFSGLQPYQWRGKSTIRTIMSLNKVILPFIKFKTKELQDILEDMKNLSLTSVGKDGLEDAILSAYNAGLLKSSIKDDAKRIIELNKGKKKATAKLQGIRVKINNLEYTIATGGLHSKDVPRELKSKIVKIDTSSTGKFDWSNVTDDSYIYTHWDISDAVPRYQSL